jgi:hypothetical protein
MTEPGPGTAPGGPVPPGAGAGDQEYQALAARMIAAGVPLPLTENRHHVSLVSAPSLAAGAWFLWVDHPNSWSPEGTSHWEHLGTAGEAVGRAAEFFRSPRGLGILRELAEGTYRGNRPVDALGPDRARDLGLEL